MSFRVKDVPFVLVSVTAVGVGLAAAHFALIPSGYVWFAFGVQWAVYVPSLLAQTEKYFDITGSLTYILVNLYAYLNGSKNQRQSIVTLCVIIWALRLGSFLFSRIHAAGKDDRFDHIKPYVLRFLNIWTIQGLWVLLVSLAVLTLNSTSTSVELGVRDAVGLSLWLCGFLIEVVADSQKSAFRSVSANKEKFINSGLWSVSRHPNYFGEITLWTGLFVTASSVCEGSQFICILSPIFTAFLLMFVSGVPLLEKKADEKWGNDAQYQQYKKSTAVLVPHLY